MDQKFYSQDKRVNEFSLRISLGTNGKENMEGRLVTLLIKLRQKFYVSLKQLKDNEYNDVKNQFIGIK